MNYLISKKGRNNGDSVEKMYYNNSDDSCFLKINNMAPIRVTTTKGMRMHLMLMVADTWCDHEGDGAWFGIKLGDKVVVRGFYSVATAGQRVPITLQTLFEAESNGPVDIQAVWCNWPHSGPCHIGAWGDAVLTVGVEEPDPSKLKEMSDQFSGRGVSDMFRKG